MSKHQPSELLTHLTTFRRRLRLRDGWLLGQRTFWVAVAGVIGILVLGRLVPIHQLGIWAWVWPFTIWLCAVAGFSILHPKPLTQIAQRVDLELGLKERISTALELESQGTAQFTTPQVTQSPNLPIYQQNDALATARTIEPRKAFPLTWLRRPLALAAILLALTIVLTFLPNPMDAVIAERAAIEQAAQEQAEKIEEIKKEIAESQELSPEIQAELLRQLEELAQQLRENPGDREKALADLSKLEENLRRQLDPNADQRQATLEAINAQLQALAQREDIDQSSLDLTAEALEKLAQDLANMDEAERDALAQALAEMAVLAAQSGDSALAQALASMSQAAQSGNAAAASQSSSDAAEALAQAQQQLTDQDSLQQTLAQLQNASQTMAQAGQPSGQQVAGQNPGQGQQPGQGQAAGQNPGQGQSG
ncbi:MAG: hypothetical protein KJ638_14095, partial [Chloroflexi bacterium]|nr:hypothetical protein [Chloroflexota bacterium]